MENLSMEDMQRKIWHVLSPFLEDRNWSQSQPSSDETSDTPISSTSRQFVPSKGRILGDDRFGPATCCLHESTCEPCSRFIREMLCPPKKRASSPERKWPWDFKHSNSVEKSFVHSLDSGCGLCQLVLGHRDLDNFFIVQLKGNYTHGAFFAIWSSEETNRNTRFEFVAASDDGNGCTRLPFTISPTPHVAWPSQFGNYPASHSGSESIYAQARQWYHDCAIQHANCARDIKKLPKRLLRLVTSDNGLCQSVSLCLTSDLEQTQESIKYVALSYCWGGMGNMRTLMNNIEQRMLHGLQTADLPAAIQDAVIITGRMEFQYLWVDALCICQDNREEWEVEVATMAEIFGGAAFTISALSSPNVHNHFLKPNALSVFPIGSIEARRAKPHTGGMLPLKLFIRENPQDPGRELETGPLSLRGWPLQERILAPAVLHYGRDQVFWECNEHPIISETGKTEGHGIMRLQGNDPLSLWKSLVDDFMRRDMTVFTDRLPAVSGLATRLRQIGALKGRYVAGLWEDHLTILLMWSTFSSQKNMYGGTPALKDHDISTWSWAHIDRRSHALFSLQKFESDLLLPPKFLFSDADQSRKSCLPGSIVMSCQVELHGFVQEMNKSIVHTKSQPNANGKTTKIEYIGIHYILFEFDETITNPGICYSIRMVDNLNVKDRNIVSHDLIQYLILEEVKIRNPINAEQTFLCRRIGRLSIAFEARTELFDSYSDVILEERCSDASSSSSPGAVTPLLTEGRWREVILI